MLARSFSLTNQYDTLRRQGYNTSVPASCTCNLIRPFILPLPINPYLSKLWETPCNISPLLSVTFRHTNSFTITLSTHTMANEYEQLKRPP